jgi:hypothetical protein
MDDIAPGGSGVMRETIQDSSPHKNEANCSLQIQRNPIR